MQAENHDSPDTDCESIWPPCTVPLDALVPVLSAPGAGIFQVHDDAILEIANGELHLWPPQSLEAPRSDRTPAEDVGPGGAEIRAVAFSGTWVAAGLRADPGQVWWRKLTGFDASGTIDAPSDGARSFGTSLTWEDDGLLAILEALSPGRAQVARVDLTAELDTSEGRAIAGGATALIAGGRPGRRLLVATQRDGLVILADDSRNDVRISGRGLSEGAVAVADIDGDQEPDLLASGPTSLWVWRGPFERDLNTDDAWWQLPLPAPAQAIAVADLGRDGSPDLLIAVAAGSGEVLLYADADTRPSKPSTTIGPGGPAFGAAIGVAVVSIDGDSTDAILIGDPARQRIVAFPWP